MRVLLIATHRMMTPFQVYPQEMVTQTLDRYDRITDAVFFCGVRIYPRTELHPIALGAGQVGPADDLLAPRFYAPAGLTVDTIADVVTTRARSRRHWVIGSGDEQMATAMKRLYHHGRTGPLWELLVPS
jgi:hypothetical protein